MNEKETKRNLIYGLRMNGYLVEKEFNLGFRVGRIDLRAIKIIPYEEIFIEVKGSIFGFNMTLSQLYKYRKYKKIIYLAIPRERIERFLDSKFFMNGDIGLISVGDNYIKLEKKIIDRKKEERKPSSVEKEFKEKFINGSYNNISGWYRGWYNDITYEELKNIRRWIVYQDIYNE